jgi:ATP-dependent exoDNAse (exonuclease V) alpha subunit
MTTINDNLFTKFHIVELDKIYRQSDPKFIRILNNVRNSTVTEEDLNALNRQLISDGEYSEDHIILTSINAQADIINQSKLAEIVGTPHSYHASITGDFGESKQPVPDSISLKTGAKIMLLNNDPEGRWINGTIGTVFSLKPNEITVKLETGDIVNVAPFTWSSYRTSFNTEKKTIESKEVGNFRQMPIKLAWAITIHKSQGKTFNKVIIDFGRGAFAHGQTYVALSRCTTLSGIKLLRPVTEAHIILDKRIEEFITDFQDCIFDVGD